MTYSIQFTRQASRAMLEIPNQDKEHFDAIIQRLADNPRIKAVERVRFGHQCYRVKSSDYRAFFTINVKAREITFFAVENRKNAYKGFN